MSETGGMEREFAGSEQLGLLGLRSLLGLELSDELVDLERFSLRGIACQDGRFPLAAAGTDSAAHTELVVDYGPAFARAVTVNDGDGAELAAFHAGLAGNAVVDADLADVSGGNEHRRAMRVGMYRPATA